MLDIERIAIYNDNYAYLLHDQDTGTTGAVDPADASVFLARLEERGLSLDWILTTHHHPDHTAGNDTLKEKTGCKIVGPAAEKDRIPGIDLAVSEGDSFELGNAKAEIFDTPGHTAGHISFWFPDSKALFSADALFSLGCGRLFEGTAEDMWQSLSKLRQLPDDTLVYCGHEYTQSNARFALSVDPDNLALQKRAAEIDQLRANGEPTVPSLLGEEKAANPFLRPDDPEIRQLLGMEAASDSEVFGEIRKRKDNF